MGGLLEYASYMPHGYCLFWQPWLVLLHAGSDALIALSYFAIPVALFAFLRRRPDIENRRIIALFAAFILLCGLTHVVSLVTLWIPIYPLQGLFKLITGLVSFATAIVLFRMIPVLVSIPSPSELEKSNARLRAEVDAHLATLGELREMKETLEDRVARRTEELSRANERLEVITRETLHRGRNLLAVVSSIARQTAAGAESIPDLMSRFLGRLNALATATAAVAGGAPDAANTMAAVIRRQLEPVVDMAAERITLEGPEIEIGNDAAQKIALAVHELATNSLKHGALSDAGGRVSIRWAEADGAEGGAALRLGWHEVPAAGVGRFDPGATGRGFGSRLLTMLLPSMLNGHATMSAGPTGGLHYELEAPLADVLRAGPESDFRDLSVEGLSAPA